MEPKNTERADAALIAYTSAMDALKGHQEDNKEVFDAHQKLVMNVIDAENVLRDEVAELKESVSNGQYRASYTPQSQTYADIEEIDRAVSQGIITQEVRSQIVKTVDRAARITIGEIRG